MSLYNPLDWYWVVGNDQAQVYASARGVFVPVADVTYVAWLSQGNAPTNVPSVADLGPVLAPYFARPADASVLDGYQANQAASIVTQAFFKVLFNHENRIRALEGKLPVTVPQALAAVKALM